MTEKLIKPVRCLRGNISLPGDKSISHRALILSALAKGESRITGLSMAEDVMTTKKCLEELGVRIRDSAGVFFVEGVGTSGFQKPAKTLDAGNSGTTIRLLAGALAAQNFTSIIDGDESLRKRPMRRIIEPLELMGAAFESVSFKAPLTIHGGPLRAIDYASPVASAQVKSCILIAGLAAKGITRITEPSQSRDHTERMLQEFGATVHYSEGMAAVKGPAMLHAADIHVPADISAAAFFMVAACLLPESEITISNVGMNPTRTGILDAMSSMGAFFLPEEESVSNREPRASLTAKYSALYAAQLGGSLIPRIIDEIPVIAVAATQAKGKTIIRDAGELRVKESDRITTITENLLRMGADVKEIKDGLIIEGPTPLHGAEIESYGDHRIAMSFAVAGLIADGETLIKNSECVDTSFPGFFDLLDSITCD